MGHLSGRPVKEKDGAGCGCSLWGWRKGELGKACPPEIGTFAIVRRTVRKMAGQERTNQGRRQMRKKMRGWSRQKLWGEQGETSGQGRISGRRDL